LLHTPDGREQNKNIMTLVDMDTHASIVLVRRKRRGITG